jgi:DNA-binding NtrC family response regulator
VTAGHLAIPPAGSGALEDLERTAVLDALERAHGHESRAAALLGLTRFQLYTRLKRYRIDISRDER